MRLASSAFMPPAIQPGALVSAEGVFAWMRWHFTGGRVILIGKTRGPKTHPMTEYIYDFRFGDANRGFHYLRHDHDGIYSFTRFRQDDGDIYTNIFDIRLAGTRPLACRHMNGPWIDLTGHLAGCFPSAAYMLVLPKADAGPHTYRCYDESSGACTEALLSRTGNAIVETRDGRIAREFVMEADVPVRIDWGGPISALCDDGHLAVRDSGIDFDPTQS